MGSGEEEEEEDDDDDSDESVVLKKRLWFDSRRKLVICKRTVNRGLFLLDQGKVRRERVS